MSGRAKADFLAFLDWLGTKGLMPLNTAQARKAVANKVLAALDDEELEDVTALDIDDVMLRWTNKFGKQYTPESARTYKSRFETSISDFRAYCENPVGFRPAGRQHSKRNPKDDQNVVAEKGRFVVRKPNGKAAAGRERVPDDAPTSAGNVIPIQIRPNLTIRIGPVPFDLTKGEATKIANIILAHATLSD